MFWKSSQSENKVSADSSEAQKNQYPAETREESLRAPREKLKPVPAPTPPVIKKSRQGRLVDTLSGALTVLVLAAFVFSVAAAYVMKNLATPGPLANDHAVLIQKGTAPEEIADILEKEGVISQPMLFLGGLLLRGQFSSLKAGEYMFRKQASLKEVMDTISNGNTLQHSFSLPEGLTSEQIVARIRDNDLFLGEVRDIPPEGSLLPDTYRIERGTSRSQFLARMQQAQKNVLADVWKRRSKDLPVRTPQELVILASVVEKETGKADERPRVASVFVNRINRNMRLQSDPTIIYGIVGGKGTLGRAITRADIDTATPYNTYVINGLPPGPIANPGRAALEAAANPSKTRDIFFVADGSGGHAFAETLEQHNRNVARWRQIESNAKENSNAPITPAPPAGTRGSIEWLKSNIWASGLARHEAALIGTIYVTQAGTMTSFDPPAPKKEERLAPIIIPAAPADPLTEAEKAAIEKAEAEKALELAAREKVNRESAATISSLEKAAPAPPQLTTLPPSIKEPAPQLAPGARDRRDELLQREAIQNEKTLAAERALQNRGLNDKPLARGFDAVEGTTRDPLMNKNYDLSSGKTIPNLR